MKGLKVHGKIPAAWRFATDFDNFCFYLPRLGIESSKKWDSLVSSSRDQRMILKWQIVHAPCLVGF